MNFYSTKKQVTPVDLKTAVLNSLPADNGLYMPSELNTISNDFWENIESYTFQEIAFELAKTLMQDTIDHAVLKEIVYDAVNFDAPVIQLDENLHCLELFHGPSLAFKDFGARFMARLMRHLNDSDKELDILVATLGDTGGAVALGFYDVPGIRVSILYPSGKVSLLQEKQLTTLGKNITAYEVDGTFDDCQALVKAAFLDDELNEKFSLSSANSINIARLIPQSFYYAWAYRQIKNKEKAVAMCVPSGNFGNITAGLFAKKMGLPIEKYIAANNRNDVFKKYWETGEFVAQKSVRTPSNAMDVGNPSNFQRLMDLYDNKVEKIKEDTEAFSFDDVQTLNAVKELKDKYNYIACPHTAVAYLGAKAYLENHPGHQVIFQATAHAAKFLDIVEEQLGETVPVPEALEVLRNKEKKAIQLGVEFGAFKSELLKRS